MNEDKSSSKSNHMNLNVPEKSKNKVEQKLPVTINNE